MIPRICVVPIFFVIDHTMPTGSRWKIASPISQRKLSIPAQNWEMSTSVFVPFSKKAMLSITFRKPRIRPPQIRAGMIGAKISPRLLMAFCAQF